MSKLNVIRGGERKGGGQRQNEKEKMQREMQYVNSAWKHLYP